MTIAAAIEEHGIQTTMQAIINTAAADRGWTLPFETPDIPGLPVAASPEDIGPMYEEAITSKTRNDGGIYYTPAPLAEFTARFALDDALRQVAEIDKPASVLRLVVVDPVAIDMARSAVWLAGDGHWMPSLLELNICVANPMEGEQPPALAERLGEASEVPS